MAQVKKGLSENGPEKRTEISQVKIMSKMGSNWLDEIGHKGRESMANCQETLKGGIH